MYICGAYLGASVYVGDHVPHVGMYVCGAYLGAGACGLVW